MIQFSCHKIPSEIMYPTRQTHLHYEWSLNDNTQRPLVSPVELHMTKVCFYLQPMSLQWERCMRLLWSSTITSRTEPRGFRCNSSSKENRQDLDLRWNTDIFWIQLMEFCIDCYLKNNDCSYLDAFKAFIILFFHCLSHF